MCNLSEGIWEEAYKIGFEEGYKIGFEEGRKMVKLTVIENGLEMGLPEELLQELLRISAEEMYQLKQELLQYA